MESDDGSTLKPGTRVDDYVIGAVLGRGGFGITYLVRDENLQKDFALKEFFPEDLALRDGTRIRVRSRPNGESDFSWGLKKFYDEARLVAQFNHPNIVSVRRVFQANNSAYMLLDFIRGITLEQLLAGRVEMPTQQELDQLAGPLLSALDVVHANKIWHLDISPDNIMMRARDHTPILVDFGASRFEMKQHSRLISALIFKSGYSAPEQYTSSVSRYGPWTDIYAFAATLYRAISGCRPPEATMRSLADELGPAIVTAKGDYRSTFLSAIDWALKLQPSERPQSVAEWRRQLLGDAGAAVEVRSGGRDAPPGQEQHSAGHTRRKTHLIWGAVSAGVLVLAAGLAAAYFLHARPSSDEAAAKCARGRQPEEVVNACTLLFFFFNDTATTEIYTLSLHDALPIPGVVERRPAAEVGVADRGDRVHVRPRSEEHTSELQSLRHLVCRLLLEKKKKTKATSSQQRLETTTTYFSTRSLGRRTSDSI